MITILYLHKSSAEICYFNAIRFLLLFLWLTFNVVPFALASDEDRKGTTRNRQPYEIGEIGEIEERKEEKETFDPDAKPPLNFVITRLLSLGARLNIKTDIKDNEDLRHDVPDDLIRLNSGLSLAMLFNPLKNVEIYAEGEFSYENPINDSLNRKDKESGHDPVPDQPLRNLLLRGRLMDSSSQSDIESEFDLERAYLLWRNVLVPSLDIQIGRQRLQDKREWFMDEDLDAFRIHYNKGPFSLGASVSTNVIDPAKPEDRILNYYMKVRYRYAKRGKIKFYSLLRRDNSDENFSPSYIGFSVRDKSFKRQKLWLDFAYLMGHEEDKRLRGFGLDARWTSEFKFPMKPSITLGFAFGSGDSSTDTDVDRNFRQTGLHDNSGKFNGRTKFKYYGEVFDPELSNMIILTAGVGIRPLKKTSIDLVYHYYSQVDRSDDLTDVDIDPDPTGRSRDLGHAVDLIVGSRFKDNVKISFTSGVFMPGNAFANDEDDISLFGELKLQIAF